MSLSKFFSVCTKNSGLRSYSQCIKMVQYNGSQHYIHSDGFYAACYSVRTKDCSMDRFETLIPIDGAYCPMADYPNIQSALGYDITAPVRSTNDETMKQSWDLGEKLQKALANIKIGKETFIHPVTCQVVFTDKEATKGMILAKLLNQFVAIGERLHFHGETSEGCYSFTVIAGRNRIEIAIAGRN